MTAVVTVALQGSSAPKTVPSGYYSIPVSSPTDVRSGVQICDAGFYCSGGVRTKCPVGRYADTTGVTDPQCVGTCDAGFFCPEGSASKQQEQCGSGSDPANFYCPAGTTQRLQVPNNFYSTPTNYPENQRSGIAACPRDYVCIKGKRYRALQFTDSVCRNAQVCHFCCTT